MFVKPSEPREMREMQIVSRFCHYHIVGKQRRPLFVNCNVNVVKLCVTEEFIKPQVQPQPSQDHSIPALVKSLFFFL